MSAGAAALAFEDVALRLGGRELLRGVSLALAPGEIVALVGRNGAGKTTLFRVASRILRPERGEVRIAGRALGSLSRRELARELAVVPQDVGIPFPFLAGEIVLMGRAPHQGGLGFESADDLARARAAMEAVGIADLASRDVTALSGGERQLVLVARALAQDPRVLLLDEPTAHLDLRHRTVVVEHVRRFVEDGRSALVVSHDLNLAARSCDRIALLAEGRLLACGKPAEVLDAASLRATFGIEADVLPGPDGAPLVVPRRATPG
ncbi:MAG TPA: ABC transporter ATP-binding protein [Myxococcota bacterium]|nr:ABC transporter ATP-binding protein [Myxococcota bacterium]